jgi:hypothetical protein
VYIQHKGSHTDFDITTAIKQDVVTLDVAMNDILVVQMLKALASLLTINISCRRLLGSVLTSKQIVAI